MREYDTNLYYALVLNSTLEKKDLVINGELITKDTELPKDVELLYGAHSNDVAKIRKVKDITEVHYDYRTTKESYSNRREVKEFVLPRDVCIIVWQGYPILYTSYRSYRIVTPEVFEDLVSHSKESGKDRVKRVPFGEHLKEYKEFKNRIDERNKKDN